MKKHKIVHELEGNTFYYMKATKENIFSYQNSYLRHTDKIPNVGELQRAIDSTYLWFYKYDGFKKYFPYGSLGVTRKDKDYFLSKALESFSLSKQVEISFDGVAMIDLSSYRRSSRVKKTRSRSQS